MKIRLVRFLVFALVVLLTACAPGTDFVILSGSENKSLEPVLEDFGRKHNVTIHMKYMGSVDIMLQLDRDMTSYDAVWPANSLWIALGDKKRIIKHEKSIMTSPVVFGIRKSLAEKLNVTERDVYVKDILEAIRKDRFSFMMTSATQSNSGASAYFGFLYALLGNPDVLTGEMLRRASLKKDIRDLLSGIHRSSGSSGWLKDLFLKGNYDSMVNYEAMIIEANQELIRQGREPLYLVYPVDGMVMANSPLGYVNNGDSDKEKIFMKLQKYLLSEDVQQTIQDYGRRTGIGGISGDVDKEIFNPDWGIDVKRILSPVSVPEPEVISTALSLYQTTFRKPSFTVFCLDYSGSMYGQGQEALKNAMGMLLDRRSAGEYLINTGDEDVTVVIPFSSRPLDVWSARGNDQNQLNALLNLIRNKRPNGSTDIYSPVITALEIIKKGSTDQYIPAVILMTDGESNYGKRYRDLEKAYREMEMDVPVFSITFGKASSVQLEKIEDLTRARVFDGRHDLVKAFRKAKGYN